MKEKYEIIELQFYKDLSESQKQFEEDKRIVEEIMKANSVEYALELVENQKRSYYEEAYIKGYTLNLIIRKVDLHYVLKLLDQNNIGFFASEAEKRNAISENEIEYEEEIEEEPISNNVLDEEELKKRDEQLNIYVRVTFSIFFGSVFLGECYLAYWLYTIREYKYLAIVIIFTILQLSFCKFFFKFFKNKKELL